MIMPADPERRVVDCWHDSASHWQQLLEHHRLASRAITNPAIEQAATRIGLRQAVDELQSRLIRAALARHAGNWATAARELRVDRANLRRLAGRLGLA